MDTVGHFTRGLACKGNAQHLLRVVDGAQKAQYALGYKPSFTRASGRRDNKTALRIQRLLTL